MQAKLKVESQIKSSILTEMFPVNVGNLPRLSAYKLDARGDVSTIGGKLSYKLTKKFPGHWIWTRDVILTDKPVDADQINGLVEILWREQPATFKDLRGIVRDDNWNRTPQSEADFVAYGLFRDIEGEAQRILAGQTQDLGAVHVEREYETRGWVVQGQPAISISISSRLVHKQDLKSFASSLKDTKDLIGMWVAAKTSSLKGEIVDIQGPLQKERRRLLALTQDDKLLELIEKAPDDEVVVRVLAGRNQYEYITSSLRVIVRLEDLRRFKIAPGLASKALRLPPVLRQQLVESISRLLENRGVIGKPYSSSTHPTYFATAEQIGYDPLLRFGGNQVSPYEEGSLLRTIRQHGIYKQLDTYREGAPIRVGIVNTIDSVDAPKFLARLKRELNDLSFGMEIAHEERVEGISRADLEKAVDKFQDKRIDILLAILPDEYSEDEEGWGAYHNLKSLSLTRGIQSQVVYESTLDKQFAIANIVLGILGKTGNIPYVLSKPLPYADIAVGIDIARERKKRLPGSTSATAIARIYFVDGELIRYVIHDAPLEGETIPDNVLQRLFPAAEFKGKRVVIHRDGYFRGDEKQALKNWAQRIGAQFNLVEIIKTGTPRMYALQQGSIQQPSKGNVFKLSDNEAFLVSSPPPFANATPQPLRIRTDPPFKVEEGLHSILSLTLLHYGSLLPPRLPVTIHYSDKIAYLVLRGIKPKELEGRIPFWL